MATMEKTSVALNRLVRAYLEAHPAEVARQLETTRVAEAAALLQSEPTDRAIEVFRRLTPVTASEVLAHIDASDASRLLARLDTNRAAALLAGIASSPREERLALLDSDKADELRKLMAYPPNTAGHLMDPEVMTFRQDASVRDVRRRLRSLRRRRLQDVFLVDVDDRLLGTVALEDVVMAAPGDLLEQLAQRDAPRITAFAPRDQVIETLENHRTRSLPVVDFDNRILGVLRQKELIEAAKQSTASDLVTMVGAGRDERALSSPLFAVRKRLPWLQINLVTAFLAASVVGMFESTIARNTALAILLPVVAGQSGNTGAQALAVTMRGLALREVRLHHWLQIMTKEMVVGALNGVAIAITTGLAVMLWSRSIGLGLVIALSMVASMTAAGIAGAIIPMVLTRLGQDPAQSSSIILTTVTDVVGFMSFLGIATVLSSML